MTNDDRAFPDQSSETVDNRQPLPELTPKGAEPLSSGSATEPEAGTSTAEIPENSPAVDEWGSDTGAAAIQAHQDAIAQLMAERADLQAQKAALQAEVNELQEKRQTLLRDQGKGVYELVMETLQKLSETKRELEAEVAKLEKRRDRVVAQMQQTFIGTSEEIAIRLQGFKDYLTGSLQDLAAAAEQIDLPTPAPHNPPPSERPQAAEPAAPSPQFAKQRFVEQRRAITAILDQYRTAPDYYGPPWQLRRTFEPIHAERVQQWFFKQGGRGTVRSMGSRLQNILIASAAIAILRQLYGERVNVLVLANTPERLGEWRRGLQDCLGISRSDYGPTRGVALFEAPEVLAQKAERLVEMKQLPLIILDETENVIDLTLLQFPLWLAFAPDPNQASSYLY